MNKRWMAEVYYHSDRATDVVDFEELADLHDIVEMGPNWNEIKHIVVTLNRNSAEPSREVN
jgi:hypothetical protein